MSASYFAKRLESDAVMAARCQAVVDELRQAADDDLAAVERSSQLRAEDFKVYINARADRLF